MSHNVLRRRISKHICSLFDHLFFCVFLAYLRSATLNLPDSTKIRLLHFTVSALGENCALAANQSVNCHATILFTISLNSAKVWNMGFNWLVFGVGMHKKSPTGWINQLLFQSNLIKTIYKTGCTFALVIRCFSLTFCLFVWRASTFLGKARIIF